MIQWDAPVGSHLGYYYAPEDTPAHQDVEVIRMGVSPSPGCVVRSSHKATLTGILSDKAATATVVALQDNTFIDAQPNHMCMVDEALRVLQFAFGSEHDVKKTIDDAAQKAASAGAADAAPCAFLGEKGVRISGPGTSLTWKHAALCFSIDAASGDMAVRVTSPSPPYVSPDGAGAVSDSYDLTYLMEGGFADYDASSGLLRAITAAGYEVSVTVPEAHRNTLVPAITSIAACASLHVSLTGDLAPPDETTSKYPAGLAFADGVPSLRSQLRPTQSLLDISPALTYGFENEPRNATASPSVTRVLFKLIRAACEPASASRLDVALVVLTALARSIEMPAGTRMTGEWDDHSRLRAERRASLAIEMLSLEGLEALADVFALGRGGDAESALGLQTAFVEPGFSYRFLLTPSNRLALHEVDLGGDAGSDELPFDRIVPVRELALRDDGRTLVITVEGDSEPRELEMLAEQAVERIAVIVDLAAKAIPQVPFRGVAQAVVAQASSTAARASAASRPSGKRRMDAVDAGRLAVVATAIVDSIANDETVLSALLSWQKSKGRRVASDEFKARFHAVLESLWRSANERVPGASTLAVLTALVAPLKALCSVDDAALQLAVLGPWAHLNVAVGERPELLDATRLAERFSSAPPCMGFEAVMELDVLPTDVLSTIGGANSPSSRADNAGLSFEDAVAYACSESMSGDAALHSHHMFCCACKVATCRLSYGPRDDHFPEEPKPPVNLDAQRASLRHVLQRVIDNPSLHVSTDLLSRAVWTFAEAAGKIPEWTNEPVLSRAERLWRQQ
jgi:hypothetical protein